MFLMIEAPLYPPTLCRPPGDLHTSDSFQCPLVLSNSIWALRAPIKSQFSEILTTFVDKCPENGSKNESMAPRTNLG